MIIVTTKKTTLGESSSKMDSPIFENVMKSAKRAIRNPHEMKKSGLDKKKAQTLEEIFQETVEEKELDDWFNIRGPRQGEDSREIQKKQRLDYDNMQESN
ncbi:uncharacterized protein LOC143468429 isoform X2 [Clavelina lepadiformis]|uniref:uncharacterized protein LOC143468429 isoform X2 n=1 Tax=Clavelina lepadiformis TaxID=159417 RepID=UPI0040419E51